MLAQSHGFSSTAVPGTGQRKRASGSAVSAMLASPAVALVILCGAALLCGCTIPSDCGDLDYPAYGGAWQRTRRDSGRVGSVFDPAGARVATLTDRDKPADAEDARSPRESLHSTPPVRPPAQNPEAGQADPDAAPPPSPSDRLDRDRLRGLDLDEIQVEAGPPAPPQLN